MKNLKLVKAGLLFLIMLVAVQQGFTQNNVWGAMYFQNQFLSNPAMAGIKGLNLHLGFRKQWNTIPGSPFIQSGAADYAVTNKAGIGLFINNERSGLFNRTRTMGSYAYHLPLGRNSLSFKNSGRDNTLSFGISFGVLTDKISNNSINGDSDDPDLVDYNQRDTYLDGDFGLAYSGGALNIQLAVPNLKNILNRDEETSAVDRKTLFSAISYKIQTNGYEGLELEPKLVYHNIKGFKSILDLGINLSYAENKINFFGMYHSSHSATFGLGFNYENMGVGLVYATSTAVLKKYTDGNFEISLRANLFQ
jgi:type IX secretion system PorP/SprF family membrane protein